MLILCLPLILVSGWSARFDAGRGHSIEAGAFSELALCNRLGGLQGLDDLLGGHFLLGSFLDV